MAFTFVHTADWQIGKSFAGFPADQAALLREARLGAIDRLAAAARAHGAGHILVAGDVFETETPEPQTRRKCFQRLRHHGDLMWHLLPGNHDPARPAGLWERCLAGGEVPGNVKVHVAAEPVEMADRVWLLPAPLTARATAADPTAWMDGAGLPEGSFRIGLAHGAVHGFGGESGRLIAADRAASAGLAYLALGDWHGMKEVGPRTWYSGTPEPDRFPDNEPGFALAVMLESPMAEPRVRPLATAKYRWAKLAMRVSGVDDLAEVERRARSLAPDPGDLVLALALEGLVSLAERTAVDRWLERFAAVVFHLEARMDGLRLRVASDDLDRIDRAGELRDAAERLLAMAEDATNPDSALAERALGRLYALTGEAVDGDP